MTPIVENKLGVEDHEEAVTAGRELAAELKDVPHTIATQIAFARTPEEISHFRLFVSSPTEDGKKAIAGLQRMIGSVPVDWKGAPPGPRPIPSRLVGVVP